MDDLSLDPPVPSAIASTDKYALDTAAKARVQAIARDFAGSFLMLDGDGKVWVAPLDSVTRVRTGETGSAAI